MKTKRTEKECSVLFKRMEKNAKNIPFFLKEWKRAQRTECSFEKNGCPTLQKTYLFVGGHIKFQGIYKLSLNFKNLNKNENIYVTF